MNTDQIIALSDPERWQDMVEKNMDGTKEYFPERHRPRGGMNGRRSGEDIALTVIVTK